MMTGMSQASSYELGVVSSMLQQKQFDFIIVGEMHGSQQNAPLMQELLAIILAKSKPVTIAFEWALSNREREALRTYIHGGDIPEQLPSFFANSDGRFTYEHAALLKWIRGYNKTHGNFIDLHTFDESIGSKEPEQVMTDSLRTYKINHPESLVLVETGNMHARSLSYVFMGSEYVPMAALLKKDQAVFSIFLKYIQGQISVEGVNRDVTEAVAQKEGAGVYFDAEVDIPFSQPAQDIKELTKISKLL